MGSKKWYWENCDGSGRETVSHICSPCCIGTGDPEQRSGSVKNGPRKVKIRPDTRNIEFSKNLKGQVDRTDGLARATLGVRVS